MPPYDLDNILVIGISSRALFDLEKENKIFEEKGLEEYTEYQLQHVDNTPRPGTGFRLVKNILALNSDGVRKVEVVILSRNNAATMLRITKAIEHYGLDITRTSWTGGETIARYLIPYRVDLFLSAHESDVQEAVNAGHAAAKIYSFRKFTPVTKQDKKIIKIAFDGDAVLFSDESERIFKEHGLDAFLEHEKENAEKPLPEGPFAKLLKSISRVQKDFAPGECPIRTALITARNSPAHERVVLTLKEWNVRLDEVHFLGGITKRDFIDAFRADIFFDDQDVHCGPASQVAPTAKVPVKETDSDS
ncbi:MAG: 5'-nucleotidase [Pseudomonadota bacterium]